MLVLTKLTISGSGFVGLRIGSAVARRACCRSRSISGRGVAASMRSRNVRSICAAFALNCRFDGSNSCALRYARSASSSWPASSNCRPRSAYIAGGGDHRPLERDLVVRAIGIVCRAPAGRTRRPLPSRRPCRPPRRAQTHGPWRTRRQHGQRAPASLRAFTNATGHRIPYLYCPVSRITCRPRPSAYVISMDSVPIFTIRYRPSMISPSLPYIGARLAVRQHRPFHAVCPLEHADELQRDRRQRRRPCRRRRPRRLVTCRRRSPPAAAAAARPSAETETGCALASPGSLARRRQRRRA